MSASITKRQQNYYFGTKVNKMEFKCNKVFAVYEDKVHFAAKNLRLSINYNFQNFTYCLQTKKNKIYVSVSSEEPDTPEKLYIKLMSLIKLIAIIKGRFLKLRHLKFLSNSTDTFFLKEAKEFKKNQLSMYTHNKMFDNSLLSFNIDLFDNLEVLFREWQGIENNLSLQNTMFFYSTADLSFPSDLKLALLTQCFEPLYEILVKKNMLNKEPALRTTFKNHIQCIIENDSSVLWPKKFDKKTYTEKIKKSADELFGKEISFNEKITEIITTYGCNLFLKNLQENLQYVDEITNNRNMVFHVNSKKSKQCPSKTEKMRLIWKFSILYRIVIMSLLNKPYDISKDSQFDYLISAIDTWPEKHPSMLECGLTKFIK